MADILSRGIDVSRHQGTSIDWNGVKAAGFQFVIIRAGYRGYAKAGTLATDSCFKRNIEGAIKAGLDIGVYWFTQALSVAEAETEAAYCLKLIEPYRDKIIYPVYDDIEWSNTKHNGRADKNTKAQYTEYGLAFCKKIAEAGYKAGVYACQDWLRNKIDARQFADKGYSVWCARYGSALPSIPVSYDIWQYTSSYRLDAIPGARVDANYCYTDFGQEKVVEKWVKDGRGWKYGDAKNEWKKLRGYWYWFDANGYAVTGAWKIDGKPYYFLTKFDADRLGVPECACFEVSKG